MTETDIESDATIDEVEPLAGWREQFRERRDLLVTLLHGALRSGAKKIEIGCKPEQSLIVFRDDGAPPDLPQQIEDVRSGMIGAPTPLSDWAEDLLRLVALMSTTWHFQVLTPAHRLSMIPDRFIAANEYRLCDSPEDAKGTTFAFKLLPEFDTDEITLRDELAELVRGFPLPVYFKGLPLPQPMAAQAGSYERMFNGSYQMFTAASQSQSHVFLEGLPIDSGLLPLGLPGGFIVHLDPDAFNVALPGRNQLAESETSAEFLDNELLNLWRKHLQKKQRTLTRNDFVRTHAADCLATGAADLLDDYPLHPTLWGYYQHLPCPGQLPTSMSEQGKHELLTPTNQIHADLAWIGGGLMSTTAAYLYASGWPVLRGALPESNWAVRNALSAALLQISVRAEDVELVRRVPMGSLSGMRMVFCQHYNLLTGNERAPDLTNIDHIPVFCAREETLYLTPASLPHLEHLLLQIFPYRQEDGALDRRSLQRDASHLAKWLEEAFGSKVRALAVARKRNSKRQ